MWALTVVLCVCSHKDRQAPFELHVVLLSQNTDRPKCTCIAVQDIIVVLHTHPPTGTHAHSHTELKLKAQRGGYGGKKVPLESKQTYLWFFLMR